MKRPDDASQQFPTSRSTLLFSLHLLQGDPTANRLWTVQLLRHMTMRQDIENTLEDVYHAIPLDATFGLLETPTAPS